MKEVLQRIAEKKTEALIALSNGDKVVGLVGEITEKDSVVEVTSTKIKIKTTDYIRIKEICRIKIEEPEEQNVEGT